MARFSAESKRKLATCHASLQKLFTTVVEGWDCTILEGERTEAQQLLNVAAGVSKTMDSKHLHRPSTAVDVAPFPVTWPQRPTPGASPAVLLTWAKDIGRYYFFAGYVIAVARRLDIAVRYGGDWDGDRDIHDQSFDDLVHWELVT